MRLTNQLQNRFAETDAEQLQAAGSITVSNECGRFTCRFVDCENIACEVSELRLESQHLRDIDQDQALAVANQLVERLTYLLEPLSVIEADPLSRTVQVRSTVPAEAGATKAYYELLVQPGSISFARIQKTPAELHETTTSALTREVVCRIADDIEDAMTAVAT